LKKDAGVCLLGPVFAAIAILALGVSRGEAQVRFAEVGRASQERVSYNNLPLSFEVNRGQTDSRVKFLSRGQGYTLFLTRRDAVLSLQAGAGNRSVRERGPVTSVAVRLRLMGEASSAQVRGEEPLPGYSNYFIGNHRDGWHTHVANYARVRYRQIYPGIDLVYYGRQGRLENDFMVSPGARPESIRLGVEGAKAVHLDAAGDLVLKVSGGAIYLRRPRAYQGSGAGRREVAVHYVLGAGKQIGFGLGRYDRRQELVIDPVLAYSTYLGGAGSDVGYGIAVDSSGDAYVTGTTASLNFPTTSVGQSASGGGSDAFVTKFNPSGTSFAYSVYLGGSGDDTAAGIAIDSSGDAYVAGYTYSTNFPTTSGAFQVASAGNGDAFLTKLDPSGSTLGYSTYLGGSGRDYGYAVGVDAAGDAFVTGSTQSTDFPTMSPLQVGNDGFTDAFVTEFNPLGTALLYSTYLGGTGGDVGYALAVDSSGNPYIAGYTTSPDFPTQSALQSSLAGGADAFITEINPETSSLVFSTYLGGSGQDIAYSLALDSSDDIYLAGSTSSNDFPVAGNPFQASNHGQSDAFVAKLTPGATQLVYSTLLGGSSADQANAIALDSAGDAFVTGFTQSSDFPLADALQRILGISGASTCGATLCSDAFVTKLSSSGSMVYSTFLGGNAADIGQAIAVDAAGAAYVTGRTASANFPVIAGAPQSTYAASSPNSNVFVAKVSLQDAPAVALTPQKVNFGNQAINNPSDPQTIMLINAGSAPLGITAITASGDFSQTNDCGTVVPAGGGTCTIQVTFTPSQAGPITDQVTIADNAQRSPQTITVSGTGVTSAGTLTLSTPVLSFSAVTVGDTSSAQPVQLVNTGNVPVTVTSIDMTGNFTETNNCGTLPVVLNAGAACTINIVFAPAASGNLSGAMKVQDNAINNPQGVSLSGTGNAVFSLSANVRSTVLLIGTQSATFTITPTAPSSFQNNITLSCSTGTCSFNPPIITAGESSTLTVSGLSPTSPNPTNFAVIGNSSGQSSSVALTIFFQDFSLSQTPPSPPVASITAGQSATYKVTVSPSNGFNQVVLLSCTNLPQATTCTFSPPGLTLNGTAATSTLSVNTTAETSSIAGPPPSGTPPPGSHPEFNGWAWLAVLCMVFAAAGVLIERRLRGTAPLRLRAAFAVLAASVLLVSLVAACNQTYVGPNTKPAVTGTPANTYTIGIVGALGSNNSITRTTSVNLAVAP